MSRRRIRPYSDAAKDALLFDMECLKQEADRIIDKLKAGKPEEAAIYICCIRKSIERTIDFTKDFGL